MPRDWVKQKSGSNNGISGQADPFLCNSAQLWNLIPPKIHQKGQKNIFYM